MTVDGYDNNSDLFFDGCPDYGERGDTTAALGELPKNVQAPFTLTLSSTITSPDRLQWYASEHYLIVGDQDCSGATYPEPSCLDNVSVPGSSATITVRRHS